MDISHNTVKKFDELYKELISIGDEANSLASEDGYWIGRLCAGMLMNFEDALADIHDETWMPSDLF